MRESFFKFRNVDILFIVACITIFASGESFETTHTVVLNLIEIMAETLIFCLTLLSPDIVQFARAENIQYVDNKG